MLHRECCANRQKTDTENRTNTTGERNSMIIDISNSIKGMYPAGNAGENTAKKTYTPEEFKKEALSIINIHIEDEHQKAAFVEMIAARASDFMNEAGVDADFHISDMFSRSVMEDTSIEIHRNHSDVFISSDGKYTISFRCMYIHGKSADFIMELILTRTAENGKEFFDMEKKTWISEKEYEESSLKEFSVFVEKETDIPRQIIEEIRKKGDHAFAIGMHYFRAGNRTPEEWEAFKTENENIISIMRDSGTVLGFEIIDDKLYAIPSDMGHFGVAMRYEDGVYKVYQYFDRDQAVEYYSDGEFPAAIFNEIVESTDRDERLFLKQAFELKTSYEAMRFVEAHMDRNTTFDAALTVPLSKNIILHLDGEAMESPEIIWNKLHGCHKRDYSRDNIREFIGFLKSVGEFITDTENSIMGSDYAPEED